MASVESLQLDPSCLMDSCESWREYFQRDGKLGHILRVNHRYHQAAGQVDAPRLVELRLLRSLFAKQVMAFLLESEASKLHSTAEYRSLLRLIPHVKSLIPDWGVKTLQENQTRWGTRQTAVELAATLAEYAAYAPILHATVARLDPSGKACRLLGPPPIGRMRPSRGTSRLDPISWLQNPAMGQVQFVDGDPDHIRIRGVELRSGDIGIFELNHPGDGIFDSFLTQPGLAPHAMLYVSRRVASPGRAQPLIQPSLIEIYEGGWRSVPITTGLNPNFSWYSEWVRPTDLPADVGPRLSRQLDELETIAFDFQSRRIPRGGRFPDSWGQPSASCTNLIRIPFERAGIELPYPTTEIAPGAKRNLDALGLGCLDTIHTPTNILNDSNFQKIGIVDNGFPEMAYAQALVLGRPQILGTFGGNFCQRPLKLVNLPNWKSIGRWKSARAAMLVGIGQSNSLLGSVSRFAAGYTAEEIPRTASPTTIAFYLRSDMEAGHLIKSLVAPQLLRWFEDRDPMRLSALQTSPLFSDLISTGLAGSALEKEGWYGPPPCLTP
ncbi:hypothetical protein [Aureliella helgolandensis]|uniref:Uncharacterized protein n=1 Tax=Aureliella helgolandensis TaxID=2527968 RepID=A0A518FZG3_9BACT|nr:hypothetical protein [Aureliella helgolandensis]QDV21733.1 hypothetical protein Q31a_00120 [Aureliella helgolandensis]